MIISKQIQRNRPKRKVERKAINLSTQDLIRTEPFPGHDMPLVVRPNVEGLRLGEWVRDNYDLMNQLLYKHAALLFKGWNLKTDEDFVRFMDTQPKERLPYFEGSTPRQEVGPKVYTSTLFPSEETIALHSEYSSSTKFPMKVWFFCTEAPNDRGETPVGDARKILQRMDPQLRENFRKLGWMLIRNYGDGLGLPWRRAFAIDDKARLEEYCRSVEIELQWKDDDRLKTRQVRSAVLTHPVTGDDVWFNHMAFWHAANLDPEVREEMLRTVGLEGMPFHTYFGDGSPIPDDAARHVRDCYLAEKVKFPWDRGDLMVIDNLLSVHGREPFACSRKIRVAMTEPYYRPSFSPKPN